MILYSAGLFVLWQITVRQGRYDNLPRKVGEEDQLVSTGPPCQDGEEAHLAGVGPPMVTVVVAARNEANTITALLKSLVLQDYPSDRLEIIIVNDNSTDRTPIAVSEFIASVSSQSGPHIKLIYNPFSGKKSAIRYCVGKSSGEIILTTDADCTVGPSWVRMHASWYINERSGQVHSLQSEQIHSLQAPEGSNRTVMVLAPVFQRPARGFWSLFGGYEFSALQAITEATALAGHPVMCNAANMSFRREVYLRNVASLRPDLPSGDDMFLLQAVMRDGGAVRHDGRSAAAAETAGAVTAAALLSQRARWASKAFHYRDVRTITLAAATAVCNAAVAAAAVVACVSGEYLPVVAAMYGVKAVPDYLLIAGEMKKRGGRVQVMQFTVSELIYPFYFVVVGVMSIFPSSRRFRGR